MKNKEKRSSRLAFRGGSYSLMLSAMVLALLVVANLFVSAMPTTLTKFDISSSKLYSITSNTKVVVNALQQDVTIYWIVQSDQEDDILKNLLDKYDSLSSHIEVVKKNPDVFPTFTQQYTEETVPNNSLIVESGDRYRYISNEDIYEYEVNYYSYTYTASGFDGEGAITSAIDYVVTEELPRLYVLEGHGEEELPTTFRESLEKENYELQSLSLLTVDEIPADAACLLIYAPGSDISDTEAEMLTSYAENGGKLLVMAGPVEDGTLENLYSVLEAFGVTAAEGIVIEGDRSHYAFGSPYILMGDMNSHDITDSLISENYYPILPIAQGLTIGTSSAATALIESSGEAFSKVAGYSLDTYEKEEGDVDGPFALAVSVETGGGGQVVWFASSHFLDDMYNAYSSGANVDMAMNALSDMVGQREAIAIRSKSLNYNYLTISDSTSATLKTLMIGLFPLCYLAVGIAVTLRKRRLQNETV